MSDPLATLDQIEQALTVLRTHIGAGHVYDDEAGEAYCDWCNQRTPAHKEACMWRAANDALGKIDRLRDQLRSGRLVLVTREDAEIITEEMIPANVDVSERLRLAMARLLGLDRKE